MNQEKFGAPADLRTAGMLVAFSWLAAVAVSLDTAASMVSTWRESATFAHGFLILPITAYLLWNALPQISRAPSPSLWGFAALVTAQLGLWLGGITSVLLVQQLALVVTLQALAWTVLGSKIIRALLFPLVFLVFAVPMGESLVGPLQDVTAFLAVMGLRLSGIPVLWEGRLISTASGNWEVAEACSAIRYVIPAAILASAYSYLQYRRWLTRTGFILLSVLLPILMNGLRAYGVVALTHLGQNNRYAGLLAQSLERAWGHLIYGWVIFAVTMGMLFWVGSRWHDRVSPLPSSMPEGNEFESRRGTKPLLVATALGIALLGLAPALTRFWVTQAPDSASIRLTPPAVDSPWTARPEYDAQWNPNFPGADAEVHQSYEAIGRHVHFYAAYYSHQRQGAELINHQNVLTDKKQWTQLAEARIPVVIDDQETYITQTIVQSKQGRREVIWNWYWVGGRFTSDAYYAKFLQAKARIFRSSEAGAAIAVATDYDASEKQVVESFLDFLNHASLSASLSSVNP
jgi:exosortase A